MKILRYFIILLLWGALQSARGQAAYIRWTRSNSPLPDWGILNVEVESVNRYWVGTGGSGLYYYSGTGWTHYNSAGTGMAIDHVRPILKQGGTLWVGTAASDGSGSGLFRFSGGTWTCYDSAGSGLPSNTVYSLAVNGDGDLWVGTKRGLSEFDGSSFTLHQPDVDDSLNFVTAIAFETSDIVWIGTDWEIDGSPAGGLYRYVISSGSWTHYTTGNSGLPASKIYGIAVADDQSKWIATHGGGAAHLDGGTWSVYDKNAGDLFNDKLVMAAVNSEGSVWFSSVESDTLGGMSLFDGMVWTHWDTSNSPLTDPECYGIDLDADDNVYVANNNSLIIYSPDGSLPVFLKYFRIRPLEQGFRLEWATSSEVNNQGFIVERKIDDEAWQYLAGYETHPELAGQGSTSSESCYAFVDFNGSASRRLGYRLSSVDGGGTVHECDALFLDLDEGTAVSAIDALEPPFPNPFNPRTRIGFRLSGRSDVRVWIYNALGQRVRVLHEEKQAAPGHYVLYWHGADDAGNPLPAGQYLIRMEMEGFRRTRKVMMIK